MQWTIFFLAVVLFFLIGISDQINWRRVLWYLGWVRCDTCGRWFRRRTRYPRSWNWTCGRCLFK